MNIKILRIVLSVLILSIFLTIFCFSHQPAVKSTGSSSRVIRAIINTLPFTKNIADEEKLELEEKLQPYIRKLAHFSIYALLGLLVIIYLSTYNILPKKQTIYTLVICIIYAITDEVHQLFIPGRSGQIKDVLIDSLGIVAGIILFKICTIRKNNNKEMQYEK